MVLDYIDPGYGNKMLNSDGTALADNITIVENYTYNPFGGVTFTSDNAFMRLPIGTISLPTTANEHIISCLKFSVYCEDTSANANPTFAAGFNHSTYYWHVQIRNNQWYMNVATGDSDTLYTSVIGSVNKGFHNVVVSLDQTKTTLNKYITTTKVNVDGIIRTHSHEYANPQFYHPQNCYMAFYTAGLYVSNVIYGRGGILSPQLQVVKLPISKALLDGMKLSEDKSHYIATSVDQSCLLTIDTAELAKTYDTNLPVSHIVVGGYPCYAQNGAANITGISKENGEVTTHGSCSVSNDSLGAASTFWALEDKKISDLANIQVGWKAGA